MNHYRERLREAVGAVVIGSPTTFRWFGKSSPKLPEKVRKNLTDDDARSFLHETLQSRLYQDFYTTGMAEPGDDSPPQSGSDSRTPFVESLSRANTGDGTVQDGWTVRGFASNSVTIERQGLSLWVRPEECALPPEANGFELGRSLGLRYPRELLGVSPGFYMAVGDKSPDRNATIVRLYWDINSSGAAVLTRELSSRLNECRIPFRFKILREPTLFLRADAAVLYVPRESYLSCVKILGKIHGCVAVHLNTQTPAFTKRVLPGLGLAENPLDGESFGLHRCGLVAEGIILAHEGRARSGVDATAVVENLFRENGVSLDAPYLNPGSVDEYPAPRSETATTSRGRLAQPTPVGPDVVECVDTAAKIGGRLTKEAIWSEDVCNWMGNYSVGVEEMWSSSKPMTALGPDLYGGTSGVAVFLAELHVRTGETNFRNAALGAMRHALSHVKQIPPVARFGWFAGWLGIVQAAARVGRAIGDEHVICRGKSLLRKWLATCGAAEDHDVLSGRAGAILALLALQDDGDELTLRAVELADQLIEAAESSSTGLSWRTPGTSHRNLCGYSHGAGGIGSALLEVFVAVEDSKYRKAAERAFDYERHEFDPQARNWPDCRNESRRGRRQPRSAQSFTNTWCHGAPGIALSRLRAYEVLQDCGYRSEAETALDTTGLRLERWLDSASGNFSLCHGLCGNADILLCGSAVLPERHPRDSALVLDVARMGIRKYGETEREWPCGAGAGENPSMMLGLAGIGWFYLRVADASIPSILSVPERA